MKHRKLALYEREVTARERQAAALERIADALNVKALDTRFGTTNIAEAVAMLIHVVADIKETDDA